MSSSCFLWNTKKRFLIVGTSRQGKVVSVYQKIGRTCQYQESDGKKVLDKVIMGWGDSFNFRSVLVGWFAFKRGLSNHGGLLYERNLHYKNEVLGKEVANFVNSICHAYIKMKPVIRKEQTKRLYCPVSIFVFVNIVEMEIDEFNQLEKSNPKQKPYYIHKTIAYGKRLSLWFKF